MFPIQCATFMELRLQQMGDFHEKPHFTMENFKFCEPVKWWLKIIGPKYQIAHPYSKSGRTSRTIRGSDVVLTLESDEKKKYARIAIGNSMSSITLRRYRAVVIIYQYKNFTV